MPPQRLSVVRSSKEVPLGKFSNSYSNGCPPFVGTCKLYVLKNVHIVYDDNYYNNYFTAVIAKH